MKGQCRRINEISFGLSGAIPGNSRNKSPVN